MRSSEGTTKHSLQGQRLWGQNRDHGQKAQEMEEASYQLGSEVKGGKETENSGHLGEMKQLLLSPENHLWASPAK